MTRKKQSSKLLTDIDAKKIFHLYHNTDMSQHQIAAYFNCNQGRISEVLNGKTFTHIFSQYHSGKKTLNTGGVYGN